jgi:predicted dehydrogenase
VSIAVQQQGSAAMAKVRVGLIGCGFVAELHMYAYARVHGVEAEVTAACARRSRGRFRQEAPHPGNPPTAATIISACNAGGVQISTTSIFLSASDAR